MSRHFIYTVISKRTGEVVAEGPIGRCAELVGIHKDTLRDMALNKRGTYTTPGRRKYIVTREQSGYMPSVNAKYYSVYSKKTDKILAFGTAAECAKMMGWKDSGTLRRTMSREKHTGKTGYEFYSEPYYQNSDEDLE